MAGPFPFMRTAARTGASPFVRAAVLLAVLASLLATAARADVYVLGPMDKLHIRVAEWQAEEATAHEWDSISGDYMVGPSGSVSIPFLGDVEAAGRTTGDLASAIGDQLQQKLGLLTTPEASVELTELRPVFVSGDVETPGRYPFEPGLTVLKAVSLAGGLPRAQSSLRVERDYINAHGNFAVMAAERDRLMARRARLNAEAADQETIKMPEALSDHPDAERLIADETAFMTARRKRLDRQLDSIDDLKILLQNQIDSLNEKMVTQNRQIDLAKSELEGIGDLKKKGLVVNQRVLTIEQSLADMQGKVLDMETAALQAKQDINEAEQNATTLVNDRDTEISQNLQDTEADIEALSLKIDMYRSLMAEAVSKAPEAALMEDENATRVEYTVVHHGDEKTEEKVVDENASVQPGDVVKVDIVPAPGE